MTEPNNPHLQVLALTAFDLIAVSGPEARKFLQGQVTCDIDLLSPARSLKGAICNLKGRVISDFRLVEHSDVCYLALAEGMAEIVKPVLDKYIVFSRAQCQVVDEGLRRTGIFGSDAPELIATILGSFPEAEGEVCAVDDMLCIKIPGLSPRFELWQFAAAPGQQPPLPEPLAGLLESTPGHAWELEDIRAGVAHITPPLTEQHLPEALNYDVSGVVNFKKGCYTGQEIVARMYYRGTAKRRLYTGIASAGDIEPTAISCRPAEDEAVVEGELIKSLRDGSGSWQILAVLPALAAETVLQEQQGEMAEATGSGGTSNRVWLNNDPELGVRLQSLPYVVQATGA